MATNQQRREAAKRKLERQMVRRAQRVRRRKIVGAFSVVGGVLVVGAVVTVIVLSSGNDNVDTPAATSDTPSPTTTPVQIPTELAAMPKRPTALPDPTKCGYPADTQSQAPKKVTPPPGDKVPSSGTVGVTLKTTAGDIGLTLDRSLAPCTVNSFVSLVKQGFYTNTQCHRLGVEGLQMLQCGDPTATDDITTGGMGGPGYTISDENFPELKYGRGLLAMAKTSAPNSGGSQFFMVYGDASQLPPDYTVFGSISDAGLQVLDKVAHGGINADSAANSMDGTGRPNIPVKFTAVSLN